MTTVYVLFVIALGNDSGGKAIDNRLEFARKAECEVAAEQVRHLNEQSWIKNVKATCIEVTR